MSEIEKILLRRMILMSYNITTPVALVAFISSIMLSVENKEIAYKIRDAIDRTINKLKISK